MNIVLCKSCIQSRQLLRLTALRGLVSNMDHAHTITRSITFKTTATLSRKEREIVRFGIKRIIKYRRRHVKEGNIITYIGAGVNVLLSAMKVFECY